MVSACFWALLPRTSGVVRSAMHGAYSLSWSRSFQDVDSSRAANLGLCSTRISCQCYSSEWPIGHKDTGTQAMLKDEKDAFFVVRKGDIIGVYKSLSDCQAQVGSSVRDPPVSVYKGHAMPKGVEKYLLSCGLKGALYSFKAGDLTERLFGTLLPCHSYQLPSSCRDEISIKLGPKKWPQEVLSSLSGHSCTLEFDGSSKGNPGQSGAGVVLRAADGSWICRLREGLGIETAYASQYQAIILGLQYALDKGFRSIHVQGDSDLVCMQIQGLWKVKDKKISILCEKAKSLKHKFTSFRIIHVQKDLNSEADKQAKLAMVKFKGKFKRQLMSKAMCCEEYHKKHSMARKPSVRFILGVKLIPATI
ncbi:uncharacterized protein LOC113751184 isoform X2 [Coffea eugenioides]|uniref:uncharacterized protein LOC113751184 isoform X2 n=1 Tax=Coffea eugenioides TaxID=49369 RepID=UPI000F6148DC|nr:uncharacterized protein LOC113751184 isoform X2 [Coffea eugenioides]